MDKRSNEQKVEGTGGRKDRMSNGQKVQLVVLFLYKNSKGQKVEVILKGQKISMVEVRMKFEGMKGRK